MLFSQRYRRALDSRLMDVELSPDTRKKIWTRLVAMNPSIRIQRDPNDSWISNSSGLEEAEAGLLVEHGWDKLPISPYPTDEYHHEAMHMLVLDGPAPLIFDTIELFLTWLETAQQITFQSKLNEIFDLGECPWRISDREFFKIDNDFIGLRHAAVAHEALASNGFSGAVEEFTRARRYQAQGDTREAIYLANHSFESLMKAISGQAQMSADRLIRFMSNDGFFDDLPEDIRGGFVEQVLKTLPFLRNKLGGHGQGAEVLVVPLAYGELAIQIAAAFHNFLITKHLERTVSANEPIHEKKDPYDEVSF